MRRAVEHVAARALVAAVAAGVAVVASTIAGRATVASPHHMTKPDGSLDMQTCATCHTPDMGLVMGSRLDTCTLCHVEATHSGSAEHLRVTPELVAQAMTGRPKNAVDMPLTEKGGIWCGTCHFYHDPKVLSEAWQPQGWIPPSSGVSGAVRDSLAARWSRLASAHGESGTVASFATEGTLQLRLPVSDGSLCLQCHAAMGGSGR